MSSPENHSKIENDSYSIHYIPEENRIIFKGNFRLRTIHNYDEIMQFIVEKSAGSSFLVIDLANLEFINSSGLASLGIFLISLKNTKTRVKIVGSKYISWQTMSLKDFQLINNEIEVEYVVQH